MIKLQLGIDLGPQRLNVAEMWVSQVRRDPIRGWLGNHAAKHRVTVLLDESWHEHCGSQIRNATPGAAAWHSATEPSATILPVESSMAIASARGFDGSMVMMLDALRINVAVTSILQLGESDRECLWAAATRKRDASRVTEIGCSEINREPLGIAIRIH